MSSVCISKCVDDARDPRVPVRATYVNLYKWPESDAEFVKSVSSNGGRRSNNSHVYHGNHPRVVDSISCRQMYLRSYKFSREEEKKPQKCFGRVKEKDGQSGSERKRRSHSQPQGSSSRRRRKCLVFRKMKEVSCAAFFRIFHRFLSCGASVDVVHKKH